jgi:hypothetical protein
MKYNIASHKSMLELIVGKEIKNIDNSIFSKDDDVSREGLIVNYEED